VALFDINHDQRLDIWIGNDFAVRDQAWVQTAGGWTAATPFVNTTHSTMSLDQGDVNNDGTLNVIDQVQMKRAFMYFDTNYPGETYDWNADDEFNLLDIVGLTKFLLRKS